MSTTPVAPERLRLKTKLAYGLGTGGEILILFTVSTFALLYYNQVRGLPAHLAGLALSLSLIFDAVMDPIVGSLSDRTRSRLGRRHLYMFIAPFPIALTFAAIFHPPTGLSQTALFWWFAGSVMLLRPAMAFFHTPHLALGGELSPNYTERSKVMAYNSFFTWGGAALTNWVALTYFFKATPQYPRGLLNPQPYSPYALTMASVALASMLASAWFTRDRIPFLPQPGPQTLRFSPLRFFKDFAVAFGNRNYVWLLGGYLMLTLSTGVRQGLHLYTNTYYWQLTSDQLRWFIIATFFGYAIAFYSTPKIHARFDKRNTMIVAGILFATLPMIPIALGLMGVIDTHTPGLMWILSFFSGTSFIFASVLTISLMSSIADIADENEVKNGVRQEGMFYSAIALFAKIDGAVGAAIVGVILSLISFPEKAKIVALPHATVVNLAVWDGLIATIPGVLATLFYARYRITKASHAAMRDVIAARRQV